MIKEATIICLVQLLLACLVSSQSCPPNTAMGLCQSVPKPCFGDNDCVNGEICCPEACSRSCKSRYSRAVSRDVSAPDLLNDPRVYVGKCPDATCYNMFGGEPNECSTSNLCPRGKVCCNDGCRNVCQWTPESRAMLAQEQVRAKTQQQMLIQRQQEEMRRRQQEMYEQRQRQLATADLARRQAEARAAAEAELAAQQARAKYEANLRTVAVAQSKAMSSLQQRRVQQQQYSIQQQQQYSIQQQPQYSIQQQPATSLSNSGFVDNFVGENQVWNSINSGNSGSNLDQSTPQASAQQEQTTPSFLDKLNGYFNSLKKDQSAGALVNQINSPANANPYNLQSQQSVKVKDRQSQLLSLIQASPSLAALQTKRNKPIIPEYPSVATSKQEVVTSDQVPHYSSHSSQNLPSTYQEQLLTSNYPANPYLSYRPVQNHNRRQPLTSYVYQPASQVRSPDVYYEQPGQGAVSPLLMFHAMQTAA